MAVGEGGYLRQMCDAQHLVNGASHRPQLLAHDRPGSATHAHVDLVEDQRGPRLRPRQDRLQRQGDARQLPARGDTRHRPRLFASARRQQKLDAIDPRQIDRATLHRDDEPRADQAQLAELSFDGR